MEISFVRLHHKVTFGQNPLEAASWFCLPVLYENTVWEVILLLCLCRQREIVMESSCRLCERERRRGGTGCPRGSTCSTSRFWFYNVGIGCKVTHWGGNVSVCSIQCKQAKVSTGVSLAAIWWDLCRERFPDVTLWMGSVGSDVFITTFRWGVVEKQEAGHNVEVLQLKAQGFAFLPNQSLIAKSSQSSSFQVGIFDSCILDLFHIS